MMQVTRIATIRIAVALQEALVKASLAALDKQHTQVLAENDQLREQLGGIHRQHAAQNADLQGVLSEAQLALKHLRAEKVSHDCLDDMAPRHS